MAPVTVSINKELTKRVGLGNNKTIKSKKAKALKAARRARKATSCNKTYSTFINQLIAASDIDKE